MESEGFSLRSSLRPSPSERPSWYPYKFLNHGDFQVFAIIQASGRQFRVEKDAIIAVDGHNAGEAGGEVSFEQVLLVSNDNGDVTTGAPFVQGAKVLGVIGELDKGKKIRVFKKKRRKQYRRTKGHRSLLTRVRITDIQV